MDYVSFKDRKWEVEIYQSQRKNILKTRTTRNP